MFPDQEHGVDIQPAVAPQGLGHRRGDLESAPGGQVPAQVVRRELVVVHPHELPLRLVMDAVHRVPEDEAPGDVVRVGAEVIDRC